MTIEAKLDRIIELLEAKSGKPETKAAPPPPPKAAKPKPQVEEPKEEPVGPTKAQVEEAVQKMLSANKRKEAVAALGNYKATSISKLAESDYAAFLEEANAI